MNKAKTLKTYRIVRMVEEIYVVQATSRAQAKAMPKDDPVRITIRSERAILTRHD